MYNKSLRKLSGLKQQWFLLMDWLGVGGWRLGMDGWPCFKLLVWLGLSPYAGLTYAPRFSHPPRTGSVAGTCAFHRKADMQLSKPNNLSALHASMSCLLQLYCQRKSCDQAPSWEWKAHLAAMRSKRFSHEIQSKDEEA